MKETDFFSFYFQLVLRNCVVFRYIRKNSIKIELIGVFIIRGGAMRPEGARKLKMTCEGQTLNGRYLVEKVISRGGMGTVYQGVHTLIGKKVAIKVLNSELTFREDIVTRFYREAQAAAVIGHRNIVDVLDVGLIDDSQPYLVMEYLEGEPLLKMLERETMLNLSAACAVMEPLLLALSASHEKGVVHRDLKPDNIFIGMERRSDLVVKVIDFGISKFAHTLKDQRLTMAGSAVGTPPYMSPEQARGDSDVDFRADIYSAGIIFYEMLTGGLPFAGVTVREVLSKVINDPPISPFEINPQFPETALPIVTKALAKKTEDRYGSAEAMLKDIQKLEAYKDRDISLAAVAAGMTDISCAGIDTTTGRHPIFPSVVSPDPLSLFATQDSLYPSVAGRLLRFGGLRRGMLIGAVGAVMLFGLLAILAFQFSKPTPEPDSVTAPKAQAEHELQHAGVADRAPPSRLDTISISVIGVPDESEIYFDGSRMLSQSFTVSPGGDAKILRVERSGYEPYEVVLIPEKDIVLNVRLKPITDGLSLNQENSNRKGNSLKKNGKSLKPRVDKLKSHKAGLKKGRHGATIADEFE
jgi:serine/threonine protein kinase